MDPLALISSSGLGKGLNMEGKIKILGIKSAERACDICGNNRLEKSVVALIDGEIKEIGKDCAAKIICRSTDKNKKADKGVQELVGRFATCLSVIEGFRDQGPQN
jgi:hypothetical protein